MDLRNTLTVLLGLLFTPAVLSAQEVRFVWPVEGERNTDWFVVNYVDHDTSSGLRDPFCGLQTYDGHQGTDIALSSFRRMDSGVQVLAAADGLVIALVDTAFDRNKESNLALGYGNYIALYHGDSTVSYYAHIRRGSAMVRLGDTVSAGEPIALVGSAGNSTDPHLHFEVWRATTLVDPFWGECNGREQDRRWWIDEPPYDTSAFVIDHGLFSWNHGDSARLTIDTLRERPRVQRSFVAIDGTVRDTAITFWAHLAGVRAGDTSTIRWMEQSGDTLLPYFTYSFPHTEPSRYYYWWSYIFTPDEGFYRLDYLVGDLRVSDSFTVVRQTGASQRRNDASTPFSAQWHPQSHTLRLILPEREVGRWIEADLYTTDGRRIARLHSAPSTGYQVEIPVSTADVPAGFYLVCLRLGTRTVTIPLPLHP